MNNRTSAFLELIDRYRFKLILSFLLFLSIKVFSQFTSVDNNTGTWLDSGSWIDNESPDILVISADVNIYGELTSNNCLDFNLSTLNIHDTLVIYGNLVLKNTCSLSIDSNAVLLVFGDYTSKNKVDVINNGTMIVAGRYEMLGADSQGSFMNNGDLFLFDTIPAIKEGEAYTSISCITDRTGNISCGYKNKSDLFKSKYYNYISTLPVNFDSISIVGNKCNVLEIELEKTDFCVDETFTVSAKSTGISDTESFVWDFGEDADPATANGIGPFDVKYLSYGNKQISLSYPEASQINQAVSVDVHESPDNHLFFIKVDEEGLESSLDSICQGENVIIRIDNGFDSSYHWNIPILNVDTTAEDILETLWEVPVGGYVISVKEMSLYSCLGMSNEAYVVVGECEEGKPETNERSEVYAFTPNGDGINDFWVIEDIENYPLAKIKVFDRNGKVVFSSNGYYQNDWDGTHNGEVLDLNSYFFIIDFSAYRKGNVRGVLTILHE